jgi:hypothetical protein
MLSSNEVCGLFWRERSVAFAAHGDHIGWIFKMARDVFSGLVARKKRDCKGTSYDLQSTSFIRDQNQRLKAFTVSCSCSIDTLRPLCRTVIRSIITTMSSLLMKTKLGTLIVSQMTRDTAVRAKSSEALTRTGLAKLVSEEHELTKAKSERIVNTVFDSIVEVRDS